jgi:hypothetical protein
MSNGVPGLWKRVATWPRIAAVAILSAAIIPMALARPIDGDEGFFLMAARLISQGKALYKDFFFLHAPAVPYFFGTWFAVVGPGWYAARLLSALIGIAVGLFLFEHLQQATGRWRWALAGTVLYAGAGLVLGWFTPVKSLGTSTLFTFAAVSLLSREGRRAVLLGGIFLGLAASARIYLVVAVPCALLFLLRRDRWSKAFLRDVLQLAAGVLIGCLPLWLALIQDRQAFIFGTVEYHALRDVRSAGVIGDFPQKVATFMAVLGLEGADGAGSIQFLGLMVLALAGLVSKATRANSLFAYVWMALFVISLLPTPSYPQYFAMLIPFLIVEAVVFLATLDPVPLRPALIVGMVAYLALGLADVRRFLVTGTGVPGLWARDRIARWSIPHVVAVGRAIDEQQQPVGASWWPGYFVSAKTPIAIDLANDFGMVVADKISETRRRRFHIVTHAEIQGMLQRKDPPLFVEGNWAYRPTADQLPDRGYEMVRSQGVVKIWTARKP